MYTDGDKQYKNYKYKDGYWTNLRIWMFNVFHDTCACVCVGVRETERSWFILSSFPMFPFLDIYNMMSFLRVRVLMVYFANNLRLQGKHVIENIQSSVC